jgi:hypothetical protein
MSPLGYKVSGQELWPSCAKLPRNRNYPLKKTIEEVHPFLNSMTKLHAFFPGKVDWAMVMKMWSCPNRSRSEINKD